MSLPRNYTIEHQDNEKRYAYNFDWVLRNYMIQTFKPFFKQGPALELGCYKGDVTCMLEKYFDDLTVIEAAEDLIKIAKLRVCSEVKFIHSTFESASLNQMFNSIFLVHTLEHLDKPVEVLKKTRKWLNKNGYYYIVVPNANAPSRQIAVKMDLIEYNAAVTKAEYDHGHRITYTMDTLEKDVKDSGLKIIQRGGIFFKPFSNYQFDKLMQTDIISTNYLDGCFELGHLYPNLCASIFVICTNED